VAAKKGRKKYQKRKKKSTERGEREREREKKKREKGGRLTERGRGRESARARRNLFLRARAIERAPTATRHTVLDIGLSKTTAKRYYLCVGIFKGGQRRQFLVSRCRAEMSIEIRARILVEESQIRTRARRVSRKGWVRRFGARVCHSIVDYH